HWATSGFVDGGSLPALARWGSTAENFWRLPVDTPSLRADRLDRLHAILPPFLTGRAAPALARTTGRLDLHTTSALPDTLTLPDQRPHPVLPPRTIGPARVAGVLTAALLLPCALRVAPPPADFHPTPPR
ncbi:hypothetical protein VM98_33955, partial [Streptomyces rubellomurinus subsp. indigoferus]